MKKNVAAICAIAGLTGLFAVSLAGCSGGNAQTKENSAVSSAVTPPEDAKNSELSGSISMVGSTSMEKFVNTLSEVFMEQYPNVTIQAEFIGSGAGIEAVTNGSADIGNSSRNLKEEEKTAGAVENIVAIDGIAVVVDPANPVGNLEKEQLTAIYSGAVTNWKELNGNDQPIVVIGRESGSGTRSAFEEILELENSCMYSNELDSTGAVMAKVASTPGSIGYVSLDVLDDTVKSVKLDGIEPAADTVKSGSYFLSRPFVMATRGDITEQNELVQSLFDYINSPEGSKLIASVGLIPAN